MQKSPFPGMDPFIEGYEWQPFHVRFIVALDRQLALRLPHGYKIAPETGISTRDALSGERRSMRPDIGVEANDRSTTLSDGLATTTQSPPSVETVLELPRPRTLTIRTATGGELVTAIEVLSPANKSGSGLVNYVSKRESLLASSVNLVEVDLLRGGTPPHYDESWPEATYRVQVANPNISRLSFWAIGLRETLPTINVPLLPRDEPILLDLQAAFAETYGYGRYAVDLTYDLDRLKPTAGLKEQEMIMGILGE